MPLLPRLPLPHFSFRICLAGAAVLVFLFLVGCDGAEMSVPGVEVLEVDPELVEVVGTSDGLTLVRDLEVAPDGTIWLLDQAPPFFVALDEDGAERASMGVRGQGPREFGEPVALVQVKGGASGTEGLWTYDRSRHSLVRLTAPDTEIGSLPEVAPVPFPRDVVRPMSLLSAEGGIPGPISWLDGSGGRIYAAHSPGEAPRGPGFWRATLVEVDLSDGSLRDAWRMADYLEDPEAHHPGATEFSPIPLWAICDDGENWLYDPASNRLRRLPSPGERDGANPIEVPLPPERRVEFTAEGLVEMLLPRILEEVPSDQRPPDGELRQAFEQEIATVVDEMASVFPEFYRMRCGSDGSLWLQRFDWADGHGGQGWKWLHVRPMEEASPTRWVRFPEGFQAKRFHQGRVWGIVRDEFDIPGVAFIELP